MDDLLTPVSTKYLRSDPRPDHEALLTEVKPAQAQPSQEAPASSRSAKISSADGALEALKAQPDYETLISALRFLNHNHSDFNLCIPSPKSAAIFRTLVTEIAPNYWALLYEGSDSDVDGDGSAQRDLDLFVRCLGSITGLNALVFHLRALIQEAKAGATEANRPDVGLHISIVLQILAAILDGDGAIRRLWTLSTSHLSSISLRKAQSGAIVAILAGGRLISATGEALAVAGHDKIKANTQWLADGRELSEWIGRNIGGWGADNPPEVEVSILADLFRRSLSLGYSDNLTKLVFDTLVLSSSPQPDLFAEICLVSLALSHKVLGIVLQHLAERFLDRLELQDTSSNATVASVSGVIHAVTKGSDHRVNELVKWCTSASGAGLGHGIGIRRSVLAVIAQDKGKVTRVLEKTLAQFGDELYIRHAAALQQTVHVEVLLLSAGYVHRVTPIRLLMLLRSGPYLGAISNRIAATQSRARFLGMVVGESLSALVDSKDKKLDFHMNETEAEEAMPLRLLPATSDDVGALENLVPANPDTSTNVPASTQTTTKKRPDKKPSRKAEPITSTKPTAMIEEIDSSSDEGDLAPYNKDSDPEDSDDDPTVIQRNKLKPPVYVRDLISFLRDSESYEKQKLALETAPTLIRRKANYGAEVSFHAEELARLFVGVQDKFELENFEDLKFQSMVALVLAQPKAMAPWFSRTFFEGDYSLSQRTTILVTLGVSARELAGLQKSEYQAAASFASKKLPEKMEKLYLEYQRQGDRLPASQLEALPSTALDNITQSLTATFLEPLAAEAADAATGPDALKLQTFTERYKSRSSKKPRVRAIPNTTASLLAAYFFSPLTAHFQVALRSGKPLILNPALLGLYLQTLGVVVHAAGPATLSLPELTQELWDLLLSVRQHAVGDLAAMKGWLVAMAALLEVNEGDMRRLCETQGREVVETREWVSGVFERTRGEDGGEENNVKMLAAGVLIRLGEAIERYQALLMGHMIGF